MSPDNFNFVAAGSKKLASSITGTDTTIELTDLDSRAGDALVMGDFGDVGYATIDPDGSNMELISFTGISGTSLTGVTRGLKFEAPYDQDTDLRNPHAAGTGLVFSNSPQFYNELASKDNDETVEGVWTFTDPNVPRMDTQHSYGSGEEEYFTTKRYVDASMQAGVNDATLSAKGIVELATEAELKAGTDSGSTSASLVGLPSDIASAVQDGSYVFATDTGSDDAFAISVSPSISGYVEGQLFTFKAQNKTSGGAATLDVDGQGTKNIKKYTRGSKEDPENNDIVSGQIVAVAYDGTDFVLLTPVANEISSAIMFEASNFFNNTDITGAEAEELTDGSNADSIHFHVQHTNPISGGTIINTGSSSQFPNGLFASGYNDEDNSTYPLSVIGQGDDASGIISFIQDNLIGNLYQSNVSADNTNDRVGVVVIGTGGTADEWTCNGDADGSAIQKNGSPVTLDVNPSTGANALGYDPTNSELILLDGNNTIRKYSGVGGTSLTQQSTFNLDNTINTNNGFAYDDDNEEYYFLDGQDTIRKFDSSGNTVSTHTFSDVNGLPNNEMGTGSTQVSTAGLVFMHDRLYVFGIGGTTTSFDASNVVLIYQYTFLPTDITR